MVTVMLLFSGGFAICWDLGREGVLDAPIFYKSRFWSVLAVGWMLVGEPVLIAGSEVVVVVEASFEL